MLSGRGSVTAVQGHSGASRGLLCAARCPSTTVVKPDGRQEQTGSPPGEAHDTGEELPGEVLWSKVRPKTVNDAAEQTAHDAKPPQRVGPERTIEERSRDHAHMVTWRTVIAVPPVPTSALLAEDQGDDEGTPTPDPCLAKIKTPVGRRRLLRPTCSSRRLAPPVIRVRPPAWL
jgi:hypothetical protein